MLTWQRFGELAKLFPPVSRGRYHMMPRRVCYGYVVTDDAVFIDTLGLFITTLSKINPLPPHYSTAVVATDQLEAQPKISPRSDHNDSAMR